MKPRRILTILSLLIGLNTTHSVRAAEPPPAVMVGQLNIGNSRYDVVADETFQSFSYSCTVSKPTLVEESFTPTSFLVRERMAESRLNNQSVIDKMTKDGKLAAGSWRLVWITPGNGSDPGSGALFAVNSKGQRVAVTAPYLEVKLQADEAVAAETTSGRIPSNPRAFKFTANGFVPGTVQLSYIPSSGTFSFRTEYKSLVFGSSSVATYASTLSGTTAGTFPAAP
jgi:hypothetical protein